MYYFLSDRQRVKIYAEGKSSLIFQREKGEIINFVLGSLFFDSRFNPFSVVK